MPIRHLLKRLLALVVLATGLLVAGPPGVAAPAAVAECGCLEKGAYRTPAKLVAPVDGPDGASAASDPIYRVTASGSVPSINLIVRRIAGDSIVLNLTTSATQWGFSPDQHRFVTHRAGGGVVEIRVHDLQAAHPGTPVLQRTVTTGDVQLGFSPKGIHFAVTWLLSGTTNQAGIWIADPRTSDTAYDRTYTFYVPPGAPGSKHGDAGWGFSPDGGEFFHAYLSGQSSVEARLVDLAARDVTWSTTLHGSAFWMFSPCGAMLAAVEGGEGSMTTRLVRTSDGDVVATRTDPVATVTFQATESSHVATIAGTAHVLADNPLGVCPDEPDRTAPTWPTDKALTASDLGPRSLTLAWSEASDDVGVTGYRLHRGTTVVGTTDDERTLSVTGLQPETSYDFRVQARDAAGNWSVDGPTLTVTTLPNVPTWPDDAVLVTDDVTTTSVTLRWPAAADAIDGVSGYRVYVDGTQVAALGADARSHVLDGLTGDTTYEFAVQAVNGRGNASTDGPTATTTTDGFVPAADDIVQGAVYWDLNSNGRLDIEENLVSLDYTFSFWAHRVDGTRVLNPLTESGSISGGRYRFDNLPDGRWMIALRSYPYHWPRVQTGPADFQPQVVDIVDGQGWSGVNFGVRPPAPEDVPGQPASITGTVFTDTDADGVRDPGEEPRAGVRVYCAPVVFRDCSSTGSSRVSSAAGTVSFSGLDPGVTELRWNYDLPDGVYTTSWSHAIPLASGEQAQGVQIGVVDGSAQVRGTLFHDQDADGARDAGEGVLGGAPYRVCIQGSYWLYECSDVAPDGSYVIDQVPPGQHRLRLSGWPSGWSAAGPVPVVVEVPPGQDVVAADLGADGPNGTVSGVAWDDTDRDAVRDPGEPGLGDVVLCVGRGPEIVDCRGTSPDDPATAADESGHYRLSHLRAGTVAIGVTAPEGYVLADESATRIVLGEDEHRTLDLAFVRDGEPEPPETPQATSPATVTGIPRVGGTLTAAPGAWDVEGLSFDYRWLRDGAPITGADAATYQVAVADIGHRVSVRVTASREGYADGTSTSAAVLVPKLASTTTANLPKKVVPLGTRAKVTVVVRAPGIAPAGPVRIQKGTRTVGRGTLGPAGRVTIALDKLPKGRHRLVAHYVGNATTSGSRSRPVTLQVTR